MSRLSRRKNRYGELITTPTNVIYILELYRSNIYIMDFLKLQPKIKKLGDSILNYIKTLEDYIKTLDFEKNSFLYITRRP